MEDISTILANEIIAGNQDNVEHLLTQGADVNDFDNYGFPPLIEAAIANQVEIAELLLNHGANINEPDLLGRSALHWAVDIHSFPLTKLFLENGADPNAYTRASQPVLVDPLLRRESKLKKLLYKYGANLNFAKDFINTKLIGHRYELHGKADIVNHRKEFLEIDLEGFFLDISLNIIRDSLTNYRNHFIARHLRNYFYYLYVLLDAFSVAREFTSYQDHTIDFSRYEKHIRKLLNRDLLILPVAYEGHAITFIKYGNLWVKCDRRKVTSDKENAVGIYRIGRPEVVKESFLLQLMYKKQSGHFINQQLPNLLALSPLHYFPLRSQITGNCSWANVEGCVPTALFLLFYKQKDRINDIKLCEQVAIDFYQQWQEWDRDRALNDCIDSFYETSDKRRRATKAILLAAVLFQSCLDISVKKNVERADKMLQILTMEDYRPALQSYIKIYYEQEKTELGKKLVDLLYYCDADTAFELS